jgi:hypothetical protein
MIWRVKMWEVEKEFSIKLGGNTYINTPDLIVYKGQSIFTVRRSEDGILGIDFDVFNSKGEKVAVFKKGIVVHGDTENYSINSSHSEYSVVEKDTGHIIASTTNRKFVN